MKSALLRLYSAPLFFALTVLAAPAAAGLVTPIGVSASTTGFGAASHLIDDSGLSSADLTGIHAVGEADNVWATESSGADYFELSTTPVLTFDLGATFLLTKLHLWQYAFSVNFINENQARTIAVAFGVGGVGGSFTNWDTVTLVEDLPPTAVQTFSLGAGVLANAMTLTLTDNFYGLGSGLGGDRVGLSEVKLTSSEVPEPGSMALTGVALAGLLAAARRRRMR